MDARVKPAHDESVGTRDAPPTALPPRRLALDRMNVDGAQPAHPQHVHFERAVDPVAVEHADQVVDAVDLDAIETDHDVARQQAGLRCRPVRLDLGQQRAHLVVDAGHQRVPPRIGAVWPDTPI